MIPRMARPKTVLIDRQDAVRTALEMIDDEKVRRVYAAAACWLAAHPELSGLDVEIEAAAVSSRGIERVPM